MSLNPLAERRPASSTTLCHRWLAPLVGLWILPVAAHAQDLEVFQRLDEATRRIPRLADKPYDLLIDADGYYQPETLIFNDTETGHEVWSLTMDQSTDLANIERRNVFSADGSVFSMKGNRGFRQPDGSIYKTNWAGHNFLMEADLTKRRKLWGQLDGQPTQFNGKFDTWSRVTPRRLYYVIEDRFYRVDVGDGVFDNTATLLYTFPNASPKTLQNISDNDRLMVQDLNGDKPGDAPLFYVIDAQRDPSDPLFVRSRSFNLGGLQGVEGHDPHNEFHVHNILIDRDGQRIGWNYGSAVEEGEHVHFSLTLDNFNGTPTHRSQKIDPWGQYLSHPGIGQNGRIVYFSGPVKPDEKTKVGEWGIWARTGEGKPPVYVGGPVSGGHANWDSFDPHWFVANPNLGWPDKPLSGTILFGRADPSGDMAGKGSQLIVLTRAYDHRRGGKAGFDALPRPSQSPDATKVWFHSSMLMPSDSYTGSYIVVARKPYAPVALTSDGTRLTWSPHALSREIRAWAVYRRDGTEWKPVAEVEKTETSLNLDEVGGPGTFMVTALEWSGLESDTSSPTCRVSAGGAGESSDPIKGWDQQAPSVVTGLKVETAGKGRYRLSWDATRTVLMGASPPAASASPHAPSSDLRHYHLYASTQGPAKAIQARRFASPPASTTTYLDWTAPLEGDVTYAVTAVDRQGNESDPVTVTTGD